MSWVYLESTTQDHHAAAVHDEGDMSPEGTVKTLREIRQNLHVEISSEGLGRGVVFKTIR